MKKTFPLLLICQFLLQAGFQFIALPSARADTPVVRIVEKPHQNFDGTFRNDDLTLALLPNGRLGKLVFNAPSGVQTWVIDPELIDEVQSMAAGYKLQSKESAQGVEIAAAWLRALQVATTRENVIALAYGNPDSAVAKKIAPSEYRFYLDYGAQSLENDLGRPVTSQNGWGKGSSEFSSFIRDSYTLNRRALSALTGVINADEITLARARLAILMNPLLNYDDRAYFSYNATTATDLIVNKLKVISGRYQLTSHKEKVPVTLLNNFDTAAVVSLSLIPLNSRVQVENINNITIPAKSRVQLSVPITVIAPGSTMVLTQLTDANGQRIGVASKLNLNLTIIDSRVAWFTTGAAILLFVAALAQTIRRFRRAKK